MSTVTGPTSSTDTAIAKWNGTTGTVIQDSNVTIDSSGTIASPGDVDIGGNVNAANLNTTNFNVSVGHNTGGVTSANFSVLIGEGAGAAMSAGSNNVLIGTSAHHANTGNGEVAIGYQALGLTAGTNNVGVGSGAGMSLASGNNNTLLGAGAGHSILTTGDYNILIGSATTVPAATTSNYLNIGGVITGDMSTGALALANGFSATTQAAHDNSTKLATTAYVDAATSGGGTITLTGDVTGSGTGSFATTIKSNVALAGNPTTTTQSAHDNSTKIATTAYVDAAVGGSGITLGTPQATTSGTSITFTGIPSTAKRIAINFNGFKTAGTSPIQVRIGTSSGIVSTGYTCYQSSSANTNATYTTGWGWVANSIYIYYGTLVLELENSSSNSWVGSGTIMTNATGAWLTAGSISLSGALNQIQITTVSGSSNFTAGEINISYQ